ncbi:RecT protein [Solidesulfovibrio carbinoliphilus subsp. oakridgensis]|uniref:RecT protein n=1 Tax=Solidesulfovibrio carbinoliphilus subsp. oakridgensis TaxID=694327 RepID=G7Q5K3_9BACT|nr:recombinase RecT [Solidesulfovibrio carbinoliphilus]EHJ49562.1 RecT protein [Solidesulfovibrio carbinoliphilus subsp. oakridgensis]
MSNGNLPQESGGASVAALIQQQIPAIAMAVSGGTKEERQKRAERFARVALTTIRNNDKLAQCRVESLLGALMTSASLNLEIDPRGLAYLIPYGREAQLQIGYKGIKELAYRAGGIKAIYAEVVYKPEVEAGMFTIEIGLSRSLTHKLDPLRPELRNGDLVLAYAVAEMEDGRRHFAYCLRDEVEKRRKTSKMNTASPDSTWGKWAEEMWRKTAVKKLCKDLPQSTEDAMAKAVALDDQAEAGVPQTFDLPKDFIDVTPEPKTASDRAAQVLGKTEAEAAPPVDAPTSVPCPNRPNDETGGFWDVKATVCEGCMDRGGCPSWVAA